MSRRMPAQRPATSQQTVETPEDFLDAVRSRFGELHVDLACTPENAKAIVAHTLEADEKFAWSRYTRGTLWLNPPFSDIELFARRSAEHVDRFPQSRILMLSPASVSTNWFHDYVWNKARVLALNPRIRFVGHTHDFPKDMVLSVFGFGLGGFDHWQWKARKPPRTKKVRK